MIFRAAKAYEKGQKNAGQVFQLIYPPFVVAVV